MGDELWRGDVPMVGTTGKLYRMRLSGGLSGDVGRQPWQRESGGVRIVRGLRYCALSKDMDVEMKENHIGFDLCIRHGRYWYLQNQRRPCPGALSRTTTVVIVDLGHCVLMFRLAQLLSVIKSHNLDYFFAKGSWVSISSLMRISPFYSSESSSMLGVVDMMNADLLHDVERYRTLTPFGMLFR